MKPNPPAERMRGGNSGVGWPRFRQMSDIALLRHGHGGDAGLKSGIGEEANRIE